MYTNGANAAGDETAMKVLTVEEAARFPDRFVNAICEGLVACIEGTEPDDVSDITTAALATWTEGGVRCDHWRDGETGLLYLYAIDAVPDFVPKAFWPKRGHNVEDGPYAPLLSLPPGATHMLDAPEHIRNNSAALYRWVQRVRTAARRIGASRGKAFLARQQGHCVEVRCLFDKEGPAPMGRPRTQNYAELWDLQPGAEVLVCTRKDAEAAKIRVSAYRIAEQRGVKFTCKWERGAGVWVRCAIDAPPVPDHAADLFE